MKSVQYTMNAEDAAVAGVELAVQALSMQINSRWLFNCRFGLSELGDREAAANLVDWVLGSLVKDGPGWRVLFPQREEIIERLVDLGTEDLDKQRGLRLVPEPVPSPISPDPTE